MKLDPIINSLLDTDLYKFNMLAVFLTKHSDVDGAYLFKCRNKGVIFTEDMVKEINEQIDHLCTLSFTEDERNYLKTIRFMKNGFIEFLRFWHPCRDYVFTHLNEDGTLNIRIEGPLFAVMMFEIYLLEIVNEVFFRMSDKVPAYDILIEQARERLNEKIKKFNNKEYNFNFAEFGCRRRLSREWEDEVVRTLKDKLIYHNMVGTSNVYLAKKYNLTPIGTYAHEFVQMYQGIPDISIAHCNKYALNDWYDYFKGDNGIALTDTITTDAFLLDFDRAACNNFTGVRHDSGDPYIWGNKMITHYKKYGIDPHTKTLLFSDSLTLDKAENIYNYFKDETKVAFGIGTFITNDTGVEPLNIVIKLQEVNGNPVAKVSDDEGKVMCCNNKYLNHLKDEIKFRTERGK